MPTRADLEKLGESGLVQAICSAGGFLVVAQKLGLRTQRKPSGFWEDINNLDEVGHCHMQISSALGLPLSFLLTSS